MVMIHGYIAALAIGDLARGMNKSIPDGWTFTVLIPGSLDLVGRRGATPDKISGEGYKFTYRTLLNRTLFYPRVYIRLC